MVEGHGGELLTLLETQIADDSFVGSATAFIDEVNQMVAGSLAGGEFYHPPDPFKGDGAEQEFDTADYYRMFWRMFDRTPAAMIQGFAVPLRRILAKKLFRQCGDGVIIHHNVLFSDGANISLGDGVLVNRNSMLDDRGRLMSAPTPCFPPG